MTKYNPELKAQIVQEYLSTSQSSSDLGEKYNISRRLISKWVQCSPVPRYRRAPADRWR